MLLGVNHHWGTYAHISCCEFTPLHSAHVLSFTANVHEGEKKAAESDTMRRRREECRVAERGREGRRCCG